MTAADTAPAQSCPVCGDSRHLTLLCRADGADVFTCATCGADHVFPPPDAAALKAYYDRAAWFEGGEKGGYENYDAQTSNDLLNTVLAPFAGQTGLSILDVGCGYGTHLAAAAKQGWACFGVELSDHARKVAKERLGGSAHIVENVSDLIPHAFDVVLLLDVIEHLPSPYPTLYQLFSIGAITEKTLLVVSTPNAGSAAARRDPAGWPYRHPASHLVHYSARALEYLLNRLHFKAPAIQEIGPAGDGLLATARGSDFTEFMRERYVPGTWSKLAEYEHLPRYALAKPLAAGKSVLDFGCGTGYGAAIMAHVAAAVTGLDIDPAALTWAGENHRNPKLSFRRHDDLGASLPPASFDLITCFEMIEHVDFETQKAAVASMARLLRDDGVLVISTPNPEVTALYGANPYHLREMNEAELRDLMAPHFPHIEVLRQHVRVGIAIDRAGNDQALIPGDLGGGGGTKPLAFLAICSRKPVPTVANRVLFDHDIDYISQFMQKEHALNAVRLEAYQQSEKAFNLHNQLDQAAAALRETQAAKAQLEGTLRAELRQQGEDLYKQGQELRTLHIHYHNLERRRHAELTSPRFLVRQLGSATKTRIKTIANNWWQVLRAGADDVQMWGGPHTDDSASDKDQQPLPPPTDYRCSLVIPTKNGGELFKRVVAGLLKQSHWQDVEFIVVDSGSSDDTIATARAAGAKVLTVAPADFNHGATRDFAISQATHNRVILTVQDAIPYDEHTIARLLAALDQDKVAGVYARQIPQPDADVITKRNLYLHLTGRAKRHVTEVQDLAAYDALSAMQKYALSNFDNVCSAIRKDVWEQERFGRCNFGEDIDWGQRALKRGYKLMYEPTAAVIHSHDRPMSYEYKRNYICHRKLYSLFGVQVTPSITTVIQGWIHWTLRDVIYIARAEKRWPVKLELIWKTPALNFLRVLGQYQAVRDEKAGTARTVTGV